MNILYETFDGSVNELYHYGVLGMKWGVRRANRLSRKAEKSYRSSDKQYAKAQNSAAKSLNNRKKTEKTLKRVLNASESSAKALRDSLKADRIRDKHESKYQKKVAKNEKKLEKAVKKGADAETVAKLKTKGDEFIKAHNAIMNSSLKSQTSKYETHNTRVYNLVSQLDARQAMYDRLYGD